MCLLVRKFKNLIRHFESMNKEEMTRVVNDELGHIPRGKDFDSQAQLRLYYNALRREDLKLGRTKQETLSRCVNALKQSNPAAQPRFDASFFNQGE